MSSAATSTLKLTTHFRTWLIGVLKLGYGTDDYTGSGLTDDRYFVSVGAIYKFNREWQIRTRIAAGLADRLATGKLVHSNIGAAGPALAALKPASGGPPVAQILAAHDLP